MRLLSWDTFQRSDEAGTSLLTQFEVVLFLFKCIVRKTKSETHRNSELNFLEYL